MKGTTKGVLVGMVGVGAMAGAGLMGAWGRPESLPAAAAGIAATGVAADAFGVDPVHSNVVFKIKHLGVSEFYGRFNKVSGSFHLDAAQPSSSALSITIDTDSIDTNNGQRDTHLKSQDFFSAKEFPKITFTGKTFEKKGEHAFLVTGDLAMHGKTRPVTVEVTHVGTGSGMQPGTTISGISASFTVKRSDFGVGIEKFNGALGDEVGVMVGLEGSKGGK